MSCCVKVAQVTLCTEVLKEARRRAKAHPVTILGKARFIFEEYTIDDRQSLAVQFTSQNGSLRKSERYPYTSTQTNGILLLKDIKQLLPSVRGRTYLIVAAVCLREYRNLHGSPVYDLRNLSYYA